MRTIEVEDTEMLPRPQREEHELEQSAGKDDETLSLAASEESPPGQEDQEAAMNGAHSSDRAERVDRHLPAIEIVLERGTPKTDEQEENDDKGLSVQNQVGGETDSEHEDVQLESLEHSNQGQDDANESLQPVDRSLELMRSSLNKAESIFAQIHTRLNASRSHVHYKHHLRRLKRKNHSMMCWDQSERLLAGHAHHDGAAGAENGQTVDPYNTDLSCVMLAANNGAAGNNPAGIRASRQSNGWRRENQLSLPPYLPPALGARKSHANHQSRRGPSAAKKSRKAKDADSRSGRARHAASARQLGKARQPAADEASQDLTERGEPVDAEGEDRSPKSARGPGARAGRRRGGPRASRASGRGAHSTSSRGQPNQASKVVPGEATPNLAAFERIPHGGPPAELEQHDDAGQSAASSPRSHANDGEDSEDGDRSADGQELR